MTDVDIYLDVDGVLNACGVTTSKTWGWGESTQVYAHGFPIRYSKVLVERFNTLAARPDVHMYWLTTWEDLAGKELCPQIGLDGADWPVLGAGTRYEAFNGVWWKFTAASRHFAESANRAVWIDDDLRFESQAVAWAREHEDAGTLMTICPLLEDGLTMRDFDQMVAWIDCQVA